MTLKTYARGAPKASTHISKARVRHGGLLGSRGWVNVILPQAGEPDIDEQSTKQEIFSDNESYMLLLVTKSIFLGCCALGSRAKKGMTGHWHCYSLLGFYTNLELEFI